MKVGITGAGGYVGSHFAAWIANHGHDVVPLTRERGFRLGEPLPPDLVTGLDVVIHAAYDFSATGWDKIHRANVLGSLALLDAAMAAGVSQFVFISSLAAFHGCQSLYGKGKIEVEEAVLRRGGCVVRPGTIYGGKGGGLFQSVSRLVAKAPVVPLPGGGHQALFLVHIDDLSALVETMIRVPLGDGRRLIMAAYPESVEFKEVLLQLARQQGLKRVFLPVPSALMLLPLQAAEAIIGPRLPVRSDSLVSLLNPNPTPDFTLPEPLAGVRFRSFG
jgi:nucleoside-diphosphate-sugar epimerase